MPKYLLARDVYVCVVDNRCIWFDVTRNSYFGSKATDIAFVEGGVDDPSMAGNISTDRTSVDAGGAKLLKHGLLTDDSARGHRAEPVCVDSIREALIADHSRVSPKIGGRDVLRFLVACISTLVMLRRFSLGMALRNLEKKKSRVQIRTKHADRERVRELVCVFVRLRIFAYTVRQACLFDSLALARFLLAYSEIPQVVIGVSTQPFRSHCWVQVGDLVANSEPEFTKRFKPIFML